MRSSWLYRLADRSGLGPDSGLLGSVGGLGICSCTATCCCSNSSSPLCRDPYSCSEGVLLLFEPDDLGMLFFIKKKNSTPLIVQSI